MRVGLLTPLPAEMLKAAEDRLYHQGHAAGLLFNACVKTASDAAVVHALTGQLYLSKSGWLLLRVPNALGRGAFDALRVVGAELPGGPEGEPYNAHISVMSADEIESIGGPGKITERGHEFHYTTGAIKEVAPGNWPGVSKVWYIAVDSPELRRLRKTYGLEPLRKGYDHHITIAVKRTGVEHDNGVSKFDVDHDRERSTTTVKMGKELISDPFSDEERIKFDPFIDAIDDPAAVLAKLAGYKAELEKKLEEARQATDDAPTDAQKASGNYRKGRFSLHGLPLTIETAKGMTRSGTDKGGKAWSITMQDDYGYIRQTESEADGDHVDVFIGPDLDSYMVYVVDQEVDGKFDEHKAVLGCRTKPQAKEVYLRNYADDWKGFAGIKSMHMNEFKLWLAGGDTGNPVA